MEALFISVNEPESDKRYAKCHQESRERLTLKPPNLVLIEVVVIGWMLLREVRKANMLGLKQSASILIFGFIMATLVLFIAGKEGSVFSHFFLGCCQTKTKLTQLFYQSKIQEKDREEQRGISQFIIRFCTQGLLRTVLLQNGIMIMSEQNQLKQELFRHSFYRQNETTIPTDFVYDEVYKSASSKNKYSKDPKYIYYNALLSMKQKLSQEQAPVFNNLFNPQPRKVAPLLPVDNSQKKSLLPIYHVEKINKMKFKIYKQGGAQHIDKLPITDLSFQIKVRGEEDRPGAHFSKPRLEEILSEYRKMNANTKHSRSRVTEKSKSLAHGSELNMKVMRKTVHRFGRSGSQRQ